MEVTDMAKQSKSEKGLTQRVATLEREVTQLRSTSPARPEDQLMRQAMGGERPDFIRENAAGRNQDVGVSDRIAALKGSSRSDLADDRTRGSSSPLGHGKTKRG
jgi:hypothetical protein